MSHMYWWLVDVLSQVLDSEEREAVRGDLAESSENAGRALADVFGLIIRRQAACWLDWRPWLALMGVVIPLGLLLSFVSRWWADGSAIRWWFYVNNWTWGYLESPGARRDLVDIWTGVAVDYLALIGWSWTSGFVLGSLSRRTLWFTVTMFCLIVIGGTFGSITAPRTPSASVVFSLPFYGLLFPLIVRILLVLFPAVLGIRQSLRQSSLPMRTTIWVTIAILTVTLMAWRGLEASIAFGTKLIAVHSGPDRIMGTADDPRPLRLLSFFVMWPGLSYTCLRSRLGSAFLPAVRTVRSKLDVELITWRAAVYETVASFAFRSPTSLGDDRGVWVLASRYSGGRFAHARNGLRTE